jgi:hypothetical protein
MALPTSPAWKQEVRPPAAEARTEAAEPVAPPELPAPPAGDTEEKS